MSAPTRRAVLAGASLGALPAAAMLPAASPDADLIAACDRFVVMEAEYARLARATDFLASEHVTPAMAALLAQFEAHSDVHHTLGEDIAAMVATTPEGLRAKARGVLAYLAGDGEPGDMIGRLERSIALDLVGRVEA